MTAFRRFNDRLRGYRTIIAQAALAMLGAGVEAAHSFDWSPVLPPAVLGPFLIAVAMVNTGLRFVTTTPVGRSATTAPASADGPAGRQDDAA
jgi:hypothetical protein